MLGLESEKVERSTNLGLADSAVAQTRASFAGHDLYPSLAGKAAALFFSLANNHPFIDGNKRTALLSMLQFLSDNGYALRLSSVEETHRVALSVVSGHMSRDALTKWIEDRLELLP